MIFLSSAGNLARLSAKNKRGDAATEIRNFSRNECKERKEKKSIFEPGVTWREASANPGESLRLAKKFRKPRTLPLVGVQEHEGESLAQKSQRIRVQAGGHPDLSHSPANMRVTIICFRTVRTLGDVRGEGIKG